MDQLGARTLTTQLAEDLGWLEQHCRSLPGHSGQAVELRLAAALVRNVVAPFLDDQGPDPIHVAVVGGAGAGKSTVANLLTGASAAEANPQAGFTRHPIAYTGGNGPITWTSHLGFLGPLQRLAQPGPSSIDSDVYQVRRVAADPASAALFRHCVVWDCPDMTTWAATGYVPRLLEVAALADAVVYVASDERYNDEVPTQFLRLLLDAGKPVVVVLMKMREADAPVLLEHFRTEVLSRMPGAPVACLTIPHLSPAELADPARLAGRCRIPLLNQVAVLVRPPSATRRHTLYGALGYLATHLDRLLAAARTDVAALEGWRATVLAGQAEFDGRYRKEFLTSEKFRRFDDALVKLLELLELPGVGRIVSNTLWVLRTPYRLLRDLVSSAFTRPDAQSLPEMEVLDEALAGWLDMLRKEAARREDSHPVWAHVAAGFSGNLGDLARDRFQQGYRAFQLSQADETDRTARAIYEDLEKNPVMLNTLRGGKFALEVGAIVGSIGSIALAGINPLYDILVAPLAASLTHQLVEWFGWQYVEGQREHARLRQQGLLAQHVSGPLAEWLAGWPATGGSSFERLQIALRRIPVTLQQVSDAVTRAVPAEAG
jgi:hypothetical protein